MALQDLLRDQVVLSLPQHCLDKVGRVAKDHAIALLLLSAGAGLRLHELDMETLQDGIFDPISCFGFEYRSVARSKQNMALDSREIHTEYCSC